jgi:hypothetical protein
MLQSEIGYGVSPKSPAPTASAQVCPLGVLAPAPLAKTHPMSFPKPVGGLVVAGPPHAKLTVKVATTDTNVSVGSSAACAMSGVVPVAQKPTGPGAACAVQGSVTSGSGTDTGELTVTVPSSPQVPVTVTSSSTVCGTGSSSLSWDSQVAPVDASTRTCTMLRATSVNVTPKAHSVSAAAFKNAVPRANVGATVALNA